MGFVDAVKTGFHRYFDFEGRSSRSEYWWWFLFVVLVNIVLSLLHGGGGSMLSNLFALVVFIPNIAVGVRRLHDIGQSGWWYLLWLIPVVGWIVLIYWGVREGDAGDNEYGPDPLVIE